MAVRHFYTQVGGVVERHVVTWYVASLWALQLPRNQGRRS